MVEYVFLLQILYICRNEWDGTRKETEKKAERAVEQCMLTNFSNQSILKYL